MSHITPNNKNGLAGSKTLLSLIDTPDSYTGEGGKVVKVKLDESGVEFVTSSAGQTYTPGSVIFAGATGDIIQDNANLFFDDTNNRLGVGTTTPAGILDVTSTTSAFYPPRMTTTERDAMTGIVAGAMIYNTTTNKHQGYNGTLWFDLY